MHKKVDLPVYYFGTPVIYVSTINEDGSVNIAPSSSIWWLGKSCMIGLEGSSKTAENLKHSKECVINMVPADLVNSVHSLSRATGIKNVPFHKKAIGYTYVKDKAKKANITLEKSTKVSAPRVVECPIQLEGKVNQIHPFSNSPIPMFAFEISIEAAHVEEALLYEEKISTGGVKEYLDPGKWHPLIMSFGQYFTTHEKIHSYEVSGDAFEKYRVPELSGLIGRVISRAMSFLYRKYL